MRRDGVTGLLDDTINWYQPPQFLSHRVHRTQDLHELSCGPVVVALVRDLLPRRPGERNWQQEQAEQAKVYDFT